MLGYLWVGGRLLELVLLLKADLLGDQASVLGDDVQAFLLKNSDKLGEVTLGQGRVLQRPNVLPLAAYFLHDVAHVGLDQAQGLLRLEEVVLEDVLSLLLPDDRLLQVYLLLALLSVVGRSLGVEIVDFGLGKGVVGWVWH